LAVTAVIDLRDAAGADSIVCCVNMVISFLVN
jgi:hypothetical protein